MSLIVCKFGGSSVCDAEMFLRVQKILNENAGRKYIVLSAPGRRTADDEKITDLLYRAYACGGAGDQFIFSQIFQRYASIRDRLAPGFDLETEFARIRAKARSSADYTVSRGEYLCAKLFAAFMDWPFVDAAGLFFFGIDGRIDMAKTRREVQKRLLPLERAVIPGFYGMSEHCGVKTFTRGGSDVSGALAAAALDADLYENWTDVDGLYSADPNLVPEARHHSQVSLEQMERIARAGASLLHPDALLPMKGSGVQTVLKNTRKPDEAGTRIIEGLEKTVPCVTGQRGLYMLPCRDCAAAPLLYPTPVSGAQPVASISAFGVGNEQLSIIDKLVHPIHIIHMQDHKQIITEEEKYAETVRIIHRLLMENSPGRA